MRLPETRFKTGFTLIELLIVLAILSVLFVVLYTSFGTGLLAYKRMEENLMSNREADIFLVQLQGELRNSFPYFHQDDDFYFSGNEEKIRFPAKLSHYSAQGPQEGVYLVEYEFKGRSLVRKEKKMKKKFKDKKKEEKETLFRNIKTCRFEYLFADEDKNLVWEKEWTNEPYVGIPRGVRVTMKGGIFGKQEQSFDILIPQGVLLQNK